MRQIVENFQDTMTSSGVCVPVDAMADGLGGRRAAGESLEEVAHDARNMVTALALYCDLLEEPGVLTHPFTHYGSDLRMVTAASRRLLEKLVALGAPQQEPAADDLEAVPIANLAEELLVNRNLLAALAGPAISVNMEAEDGAQPAPITCEDLTRVLVNLVKNAAEAMPRGGRIHIRLSERKAELHDAARLVIAVKDDGPGIPESDFEAIFTQGYTTRGDLKAEAGNGGWAWQRGLGLAVSRALIEAAGGTLRAVRCEEPGACFEIELPVRRESAAQQVCRRFAFVVT